MPFLAERRVAALGSDGNSDTAPSTTEAVPFPIHVLAINAMGVHLLDYLQLEDLRLACETRGHWEFLLVAAPLRFVGGTGSPVNPIAILQRGHRLGEAGREMWWRPSGLRPSSPP